MKMMIILCMLILIQPLIMFHPMNMVKLPQQEMIKIEDQVVHKAILMKMVLIMSKSKLNSTIKKEVKTTLHKTMVLILQSIMTMIMEMMAPSKDQLKCHILDASIHSMRSSR